MMIRLDVNFSATYLDVGANCGTTSLPVAALPQRHWVHAFEPTGDMMRLLCHSKTSNGGLLDRLVLVQKAVSESASNQTLFVPVDREDNSAFGRTASTLNLGGGVVREERVQTVSLDEYLADRRIPQVALLKSDTQGHEYAVLKGAERSLRYRRILSVFAENDVGLLEASGVAPETLWRFMHSVGFQAFNPAHESYQVGRDAATSFRRQPSAEPLSGLLPFDGAGGDLLWFPANLFADHLAMDQFLWSQERRVLQGRQPYLGKAFVISTAGQLPEDALLAAEACGFFPMQVPATQPWVEHFGDLQGLARRCLPPEVAASLPAHMMSAAELALLCSHRRAWTAIAEDPATAEDDWALVLEDDVFLHPSANEPQAMLLQALAGQREAAEQGFVYLGLCGFCSDWGCGTTDWSLFVEHAAFASSCFGLCSHAYLLTKRRARSLFAFLYQQGAGCQHFSCHVDQVFSYRFLRLCEAADGTASYFGMLPLVGPGLVSPHDPSHRGLIHQKRPAPTAESRLAREGLRSMASTGLGPPINASESSPWSPQCFTVSFVGRLGNLMFQYAALVGICARKGLPAERCASISQPLSRADVLLSEAELFRTEKLRTEQTLLPLQELVSFFRLPAISCPLYDHFYQEHAKSPSGTFFDSDLFEQPFGTTFKGYLQSYKYFHPQAQSEVLKVFAFPESVTSKGDEFIRSIKNGVARQHKAASGRRQDSEVSLTCVSVRRGDKVRNASPIYDQWALGADYLWRAIRLLQCCRRRRTPAHLQPHLQAMVIFVGGSVDQAGADLDKEWARSHIADAYSDQKDPFTNFTADTIFFEPLQAVPLESMYAMSRCDDMVLSSSTFSWWAAYFRSSRHEESPVIVAPKWQHRRDLLEFEPDDFYLPEWALLSPSGLEDRLPHECRQCSSQ